MKTVKVQLRSVWVDVPQRLLIDNHEMFNCLKGY